jgi:hypothetical protein
LSGTREALDEAVCVVPVEQERRHHGERQRCRVATRLLAGLIDALTAASGFLGVDSVGVVFVREPGGRAGGAGPGTPADDQRRPGSLHRQRVVAEVPVDVLDVLGQHLDPLGSRGEGEAERLVLGLHPAGAHPDLDSAGGDLVNRRGGLRQDGWMAEGDG